MTKLNTANKIYSGTSIASKVYAGTNLVWPAANPVTAWVAAVVAAGGTVSGGRQTLVGSLISGLQTDGIWAKLDRIWVFAAENKQSALIDLKALGQGIENGNPFPPTFTADRGYTGVPGANTYINTTFVPSTQGVQYILNSAHIGIWDNTDRAAATEDQTGASDPVSLADMLVYTAVFGPVGLAFRLNGGGAALTSSPSNGFFIGQRTGASAVEGFRNGASVGTGSTASTTVPTTAFWVLTMNNNGALANSTADEIAAVSYGGSLTSTQIANFYTRMRTYMTAVGVP
jgi:hypothetical protein